MNRNLKILLLALFALPLFTACHDETEEQPDSLAETIVVSDAEGYRKQLLSEGAKIITNRAYKVTNIPDYFNGFEMLTSNGRANNGGTITTQMDGLVYIIAPASAKPEGWAVVPNTLHQDREMKYATTDQEVKLSIYMKRAYAGHPVEIPAVSTFASAIPIAPQDHLQRPRGTIGGYYGTWYSELRRSARKGCRRIGRRADYDHRRERTIPA